MCVCVCRAISQPVAVVIGLRAAAAAALPTQLVCGSTIALPSSLFHSTLPLLLLCPLPCILLSRCSCSFAAIDCLLGICCLSAHIDVAIFFLIELPTVSVSCFSLPPALAQHVSLHSIELCPPTLCDLIAWQEN